MKRILTISFCFVAVAFLQSSCSHRSAEMVESPFNIAEEIGGGEVEVGNGGEQVPEETEETGGLGSLPDQHFLLKKVSYTLFDPATEKATVSGEAKATYAEGGALVSVDAVTTKASSTTPDESSQLFSYNPPGVDTAENGQLSKIESAAGAQATLIEYIYNAGLLSEVRSTLIDRTDPADVKTTPSQMNSFSYYHTSATAMVREMTASNWDSAAKKYALNPAKTEEVSIDRSPFDGKVSQDALPTSSKTCKGTECLSSKFAYDGMRIVTHRATASNLPDFSIGMRCNPGADCVFDESGKLTMATYNIVNGATEKITGKLRITGKSWDDGGRLTSEVVEMSQDGGNVWTKLAERSFEYEMKELFVPPFIAPVLISFPEVRALPQIHKIVDPFMRMTISTLLYNNRADILLGTHGLVVR